MIGCCVGLLQVLTVDVLVEALASLKPAGKAKAVSGVPSPPPAPAPEPATVPVPRKRKKVRWGGARARACLHSTLQHIYTCKIYIPVKPRLPAFPSQLVALTAPPAQTQEDPAPHDVGAEAEAEGAPAAIAGTEVTLMLLCASWQASWHWLA